MNKIVRILPGIFLSLLSLSSCDGLFTEDCIYKGYLHARNGFHHLPIWAHRNRRR